MNSCQTRILLLVLTTTLITAAPLNKNDIRLVYKKTPQEGFLKSQFDSLLQASTTEEVILDINQAILELWKTQEKKTLWPEGATKVDSVLEDNTVIESAKEVEYSDCVTTKKKLSTLTQENCNNLLSST